MEIRVDDYLTDPDAWYLRSSAPNVVWVSSEERKQWLDNFHNFMNKGERDG
jgi:hypothetical protein